MVEKYESFNDPEIGTFKQAKGTFSSPLQGANEVDLKNREFDPNTGGKNPDARDDMRTERRKNFDQMMEFTDLFTNPPKDRAQFFYDKAEAIAFDKKFTWNELSIAGLVKDAIYSSEQYVYKQYGGLAGFKQLPEAERDIVLEEIADNAIMKVRGFMAERIYANIPLDRANTRRIIVKEGDECTIKNIGKYDLRDTSKLFGGTRKDIIMTGLVIANKLAEELDGKKKSEETQGETDQISFSEQTVKKLAEENVIVTAEEVRFAMAKMAEVNLNYNELNKKYRDAREGGSRVTPLRNLYKEAIVNNNDPNAWKENRESNRKEDAIVAYIEQQAFLEIEKEKRSNVGADELYILNSINTLAKVSVAENGLTIKKQLTTLKEGLDYENAGLEDEAAKLTRETMYNTAESLIQEKIKLLAEKQAHSYYAVTLPDACLGEAKTVRAIVEVKNISPTEFDSWMDTIEGKRGENEYVIIDGLRAIHYSYDILTATDAEGKEHRVIGNLKMRTEGFDPTAERNFARLANLANGNAESNEEIPIVLRLPADTSREQIERFTKICEERGITDIIVQTAVTIEAMDKAGLRAVEIARSGSNNEIDQAVLDIMLKKKWPER